MTNQPTVLVQRDGQEATVPYSDPNDTDYGPEYETPDVRIVFGNAFREIVIESSVCETMSVSSLGARELAVRLEGPDGIFYPNPIGVSRPA